MLLIRGVEENLRIGPLGGGDRVIGTLGPVPSAAVIVGAVAGGVMGAVVFGGLLAFGLLLASRVDSVVPAIVLAIAGAYAGWLVGVIVFSAVRGGGAKEEES